MDQEQTRGERNHNPCNLENFGIPWEGLTGSDGPYCTFDTDEHGIRAGARDVHTKWSKHRMRNVSAIITTYAPPNENDTAAYINDVCARVGVTPLAPLDLSNAVQLQKLVTAIIFHENGRVIYSDDVIAQAVAGAIAP